MCTIVFSRDFRLYDLVIASQRDEQLDRPAIPPFFWESTPKMLAPKDLVRGGPWQGVNEPGVYVGLTNRRDIRSYCLAVDAIQMASRGDIVLIALEASSAKEAFERVMRLDPREYNGFNLLIADRADAYVIRGDGRDGGPKMAGWRIEESFYVVSNLGVGEEHALRERKIRKAYHGVRKHPPTPGNLRALLDIHAPDAHDAASRDGTCIHVPSDTYGSRSSAVYRLQERGSRRFWESWYRERPSIDKHVCHGRWTRQPDLEIVTP